MHAFLKFGPFTAYGAFAKNFIFKDLQKTLTLKNPKKICLSVYARYLDITLLILELEPSTYIT